MAAPCAAPSYCEPPILIGQDPYDRVRVGAAYAFATSKWCATHKMVPSSLGLAAAVRPQQLWPLTEHQVMACVPFGVVHDISGE